MLRLIPALILVLILIVFGLSNREAVTLGFWPTGYAASLPLSVAILIGMAIAFLLGAAIVWLDHVGLGRRARRAEAQVRRLQAQLAEAEMRQKPPIVGPAVMSSTRLPATAGAVSAPLPSPEA
jgi:lipopolysaccharide assembly protein A